MSIAAFLNVADAGTRQRSLQRVAVPCVCARVSRLGAGSGCGDENGVRARGGSMKCSSACEEVHTNGHEEVAVGVALAEAYYSRIIRG